jgi:CRP-like cAMP-binding protein
VSLFPARGFWGVSVVLAKLAQYLLAKPVRITFSRLAKLDDLSSNEGLNLIVQVGTGLMGILAGAVKISVSSADGREIVLTTLCEGDIFGEIALLDAHPRTADAIAMTDCELMVIERRDFIPFLHSQPDVTIQIIEILCSRLRRTTEDVPRRGWQKRCFD